MDIKDIRDFLSTYSGPDMNIMEVCGSHTAAIAKAGIPGILSRHIRLLSGPGCPVCVTPTAYVDKLLELSGDPKNVIATFGDMLRIPGSSSTLSEARGDGAAVEMVYSPMDVIAKASADPDRNYIFAAVGFETTTPVYALLMDRIVKEDIKNIKLLTAIKTMPGVIDHLLSHKAPIDAFIAPGHVSVVTGSEAFREIAQKYGIPFGVAGFNPEELLFALYGIVSMRGRGEVKNFYPSVVTKEGNPKAKVLMDKYFEPSDAVWRGLGVVPGSGRLIKKEYEWIDAGSRGLDEDDQRNPACRCSEVLSGRIKPGECPLFGKVCTPLNPQGACMVSEEGSCHAYLVNHREY
ncbi:MAG: hydrogenase formation protein HypD [Lachnospiraceae bacterium]|nr:hydrogenase formation protein HypD [Lachnospiraceae bacterium]